MARMGKKVGLTAREREIAISAIASRASGIPTDAARQVLAGIAVLDGDHAPIVVWPKEVSREQMPAWHEGEAAFWRECIARRAEDLSLLTRSADEDQIVARTDEPTALADKPLPHSV
ncbi:hypothetical protein D3C78_1540780 [compost metagenome]